MNPDLVFILPVLLFSVVVHEYAHGWMAKRCGDMTAELSGRLTFNPIPHIDPIGTILVPIILSLTPGNFFIAWAKPVPVNPMNFRNPGLDNVKVSGAGPLSNIILAVICRILLEFFSFGLIYGILSYAVAINILLAVFNMVPIHPLDGSHILEYYIPYNFKETYHRFQSVAPFILLLLIFTQLLWVIITPIYSFVYNFIDILVGIFF
ncbi:site-2 protease family protein [candidate division KSB1 bacterium]